MKYLTYNVRDYFSAIYPLENKTILDFGCNHGNFLLTDFNGSYIGLDIDKNQITANRQKWPQHLWIHYNHYNYQYNCDITVTTIWPEIPKSDVAIAFSVFTHCDFLEFNSTINKLLTNTDLVLATFFSNQDRNIIKRVLDYHPEWFSKLQDRIIEKIETANVTYVCVNTLTNDVMIFQNIHELPRFSNELYFLSFYNDDWLASATGGTIIDNSSNFTGILGVQRCLKLSTPR